MGGARLAKRPEARKRYLAHGVCASQTGAKAHIGGAQRQQDKTQGDRDVASMGLNLEEQKAVDRFRKDVVEPSMTNLVVLDFWAEWCGPCKALTPVLEKVCTEYADKGVVLAKINVDEEQFIAAQFQVRSIPTVYAIFQGQPIADLTAAMKKKGIDVDLVADLKKSGNVIGLKMCGAGGGGCFILVTKGMDHKVIDAKVKEHGMEVLPFKVESPL